ncbi:MAG: hypothetical protein CL908_02105 [Deltaproteobacteria bacterium]|nr:hypothetical protein [Deltaproteobacteria bacterium]
MRIDGLTKSLVFGAGAAITLVFVLHLAAPLVGAVDAVGLYLVVCTVAYAALLGACARQAWRNAIAALAGSVVVVLLGGGLWGLAIGLTCVLGLVRSGLERRMRPARALVVETLLGLFALGFSAWIVAPGWLGMAVSLWAYVLVQSLYFLVPGRGHSKSGGDPGDPFERAHERLLGLLEEA